MSSQLIVAGLDLGSHCVKCVIGLLHGDGQLDVIVNGRHHVMDYGDLISGVMEPSDVRMPQSLVGGDALDWVELQQPLQEIHSHRISSRNQIFQLPLGSHVCLKKIENIRCFIQFEVHSCWCNLVRGDALLLCCCDDGVMDND